MHEAFVVMDYHEAFRPAGVRKCVADRMGIDVRNATRYYSSVGDTLNGLEEGRRPPVAASSAPVGGAAGCGCCLVGGGAVGRLSSR
eukprot:SAG22_NODE_4675_length_1196_cov_1.260711_1_plen_86_part_00